MKSAIAILVLLVAQPVFSQGLKKKYFGTYSGLLNSYTVVAGGAVFEVDTATVTFTIAKQNAVETIGTVTNTGSWALLESHSDYYVIVFAPAGSAVRQKYYLDRKSRKLERKGIYPQPDCTLEKVKS